MLRHLVATLIRAYQVLMPPLYRGGCRHHPTCSEYAREAVLRHGVLPGLRLAVQRIARCHPLGSSGYDPVP
jgi:putative membrane protein insertion efficiency factor